MTWLIRGGGGGWGYGTQDVAVRFSRTVGYMEEGRILIFCIGKPRTACRYRQSDPEGWELRVPEMPAVRSQRELPVAMLREKKRRH